MQWAHNKKSDYHSSALAYVWLQLATLASSWAETVSFVAALAKHAGKDRRFGVGTRQPCMDTHLISMMLARSALVHARLEPATLASTWAEAASFRSHTRATYGSGLPLPLSVIVPWLLRRATLKRLAPLTPEQAWCTRL